MNNYVYTNLAFNLHQALIDLTRDQDYFIWLSGTSQAKNQRAHPL